MPKKNIASENRRQAQEARAQADAAQDRKAEAKRLAQKARQQRTCQLRGLQADEDDAAAKRAHKSLQETLEAALQGENATWKEDPEHPGEFSLTYEQKPYTLRQEDDGSIWLSCDNATAQEQCALGLLLGLEHFGTAGLQLLFPEEDGPDCLAAIQAHLDNPKKDNSRLEYLMNSGKLRFGDNQFICFDPTGKSAVFSEQNPGIRKGHTINPLQTKPRPEGSIDEA